MDRRLTLTAHPPPGGWPVKTPEDDPRGKYSIDPRRPDLRPVITDPDLIATRVDTAEGTTRRRKLQQAHRKQKKERARLERQRGEEMSGPTKRDKIHRHMDHVPDPRAIETQTTAPWPFSPRVHSLSVLCPLTRSVVHSLALWQVVNHHRMMAWKEARRRKLAERKQKEEEARRRKLAERRSAGAKLEAHMNRLLANLSVMVEQVPIPPELQHYVMKQWQPPTIDVNAPRPNASVIASMKAERKRRLGSAYRYAGNGGIPHNLASQMCKCSDKVQSAPKPGDLAVPLVPHERCSEAPAPSLSRLPSRRTRTSTRSSASRCRTSRRRRTRSAARWASRTRTTTSSARPTASATRRR